MPNHYHLLLTQAVEGGIKRFMHKIGTAYTMYFNTHTERVGPLFQGVFKAVNIEKQEHLSYLPHYIHANALDLNSKFTGWRNGQISDTEKAIEYLWAYPWSSYPHYAGLINDLVIDEQSIVELFEDKKMIVDDMRDWFSDTAVNGLKLDPALILEGGGDMNAE
jgi:putative transposase